MLNRYFGPALAGCVLALALYWGIAYTRYRFRHPELTGTQLLLHFKDIVSWRE